MRIRFTQLVLSGLLISLPTWVWAEQPTEPQDLATLQVKGEGETSPFAIKQTEPATLLYLEHDGPYWRIGPLVEQVAEIAAAEQINGDLFIRYPGDPLARRAARGKIQVGIITRDNPPALPPFKEERTGTTLVAYATTTQPASRTALLHAAMRRWAIERGYSILGPITEIYRPSSSEGAINDLEIEIQIPISPLTKPPQTSSLDADQVASLRMSPASPKEPESPTAHSPLISEPVETEHRSNQEARRPGIQNERVVVSQHSTDALGTPSQTSEDAAALLQQLPQPCLPVRPRNGETTEPPAVKNVPTELQTYQELNETLSSAHEDAGQSGLDADRSKQPHKIPDSEPALDSSTASLGRDEVGSVTEHQPTRTAEISRTKAASASTGMKNGSMKSTLKAGVSADKTASSIHGLVQAEDFDAVARRVIPDRVAQSAAELAWVQQVIIRIEAIARGTKQVYPDQETPLEPLAVALRSRFERLPLARGIAQPPQNAVRSNSHRNQSEAARLGALRELDRLMGHLALRAVDAGEALEIVTDVLRRIEVLQAERE
jgi:hypothetical protein